MDSTMVAAECIDEIADFAGRRTEIAAITSAAMRGELDFEEALRRRVRALAGLDAAVLDRVAEERAPLMPGAQCLIATMRRAGARCVLVSGGFTRITRRIAADLGIHAHHANVLEIRDGRLTGRLVGEIIDAAAKA
ncbi:MAG: HAD family hydrolase, partial [Alphaproteobacteria bacterium]